jgi:Glycosyltransferase family 92
VSLEVSSVPFAVSLVKDKCQLPNNVLKVVDNGANVKPDRDFTVCVTPFNFMYNNVKQFTEFVEVNRLFGAQKFIFYNHSTGPNIDRFLRMYADDRLVEVVPWRVPVAVDIWPPDPKEEPEIHYFAQLASLNDCLYRTMFRTRFTVFCDLDEIIVPRSVNTWMAMLNRVTSDWQRAFTPNGKKMFPGAYLIQNVFFYSDWPDNDKFSGDMLVHDLDLITLLKTRREEKAHTWYVRSKYIVWSRMTSMVSVHSVLDFVDDSRVMHVMVPEKHALLHHYRHSFDNRSLEMANSIVDQRMHNFMTDIVARTAAAHDRIQRTNH